VRLCGALCGLGSRTMTQPKLKLYTYPGNKNAFKALIAAQYVGVDIDVPSDFQMGVTNKTPEFLKLNPNGKVNILAQSLRNLDLLHLVYLIRHTAIHNPPARTSAAMISTSRLEAAVLS
jgi:Glutathione S-transferase, N-terminal domain